MRTLTRLLDWTPSVSLLASLLVACGSSADPGGTGGSTTTTTTSASGAGGGSTGSTGGAGGAGGGVECPTDVMAKPGTVITDRGAVTGALAGTTYAYKNIPFAAPPVGDLRWKQPKPVDCWTNDRDATAWAGFDAEFVVAPAYVLDECVAANNHACTAVGL